MSTGADTLTYIFYICCHIEIKCGKKDSKNEFIFSVHFYFIKCNAHNKLNFE